MLTAYDATLGARRRSRGRRRAASSAIRSGMVDAGPCDAIRQSRRRALSHALRRGRSHAAPLVIADLHSQLSGRRRAAYAASSAALKARGDGQLEGGRGRVDRRVSSFEASRLRHVGLQPQSVKMLGLSRPGQTPDAAEARLADGPALAAAGASMLVVECVFRAISVRRSPAGRHPVIGIAPDPRARSVLVIYDALGVTAGLRHASSATYARPRQHRGGAQGIRAAVKDGSFPAPEHASDTAATSARCLDRPAETPALRGNRMDIVHTAAELSSAWRAPTNRFRAHRWQPARRPSVAVPDRAPARRRVVTSIFVNRLQFGPNEDFDRYPRTLRCRSRGARARGRRCALHPQEQEMFPTPQSIAWQPPPLADELEGASRPGFFHGVVHGRPQALPSGGARRRVFGKKDRQQLKIVRGMVQQFNLPIQIVLRRRFVPIRRSRCHRAIRTCRPPSASRRRTCTASWRDRRCIAGGRHDYANLEAKAGCSSRIAGGRSITSPFDTGSACEFRTPRASTIRTC